MRQPTSRSARSPMANGPMGRPKSVSTLSTCWGDAPSSSRRSDCLPRWWSMRLPTKPWQTPTSTGTLLIRRPIASAVAMDGFADFSPRTTSSSRMTLAGLKECMPIERLPGDLDHRHWNTDVGEDHRDAAAHRAGADHGRLADLRRRRLRGHVGNLGRLALGEEEVTLGFRLRRVERLDEELSLPRQSLVEGQAHRRFHRPDACLRRLEAARLARHRFAELAEDLGLAARGSDLVAEIAHLAQRPLLVDHALGECDGSRGEITVDDLVHQAQPLRLLAADGITADDHRERLVDADETRQALRAASTRNEAELDLGLAEPRRLHRDAPVTRHRQLEPAAERGAVNGGDDRL